jgi:hypothetical protein
LGNEFPKPLLFSASFQACPVRASSTIIILTPPDTVPRKQKEDGGSGEFLPPTLPAFRFSFDDEDISRS